MSKIQTAQLVDRQTFKDVAKMLNLNSNQLMELVSKQKIQAYIYQLTVPLNLKTETLKNIKNYAKDFGIKHKMYGANYVGNPFLYDKNEAITLANIPLDIHKFKVKAHAEGKKINIKITIGGSILVELLEKYSDAKLYFCTVPGKTPCFLVNEKHVYGFPKGHDGYDYLFDQKNLYFKQSDIEALLTQETPEQKINRLENQINQQQNEIKRLELEPSDRNENKYLQVIRALTEILTDKYKSKYKTTAGNINTSEVERTLESQGIKFSQSRKIIAKALKTDLE